MLPVYVLTGPSWVTAVLASVLVLLLSVLAVSTIFRSRLPPGPYGWPIIGCLPLVWDGREQHRIFFDWAKRYGRVISFHLGSSLVVVANDRETIREVLSSNELSGRPDWITLDALSAGGHNMAFQSDAAGLHQKHRALLKLNKNDMMEQIIVQEGIRLCRNIETEGIGRKIKLDRYTDLAVLNVIYTMTFGKRLVLADPAYEQFFAALYSVVDSLRCTDILNIFPWMKSVPGSNWRDMNEHCKELWDCVTPPFREAVESFDEQEVKNILVSQFLSAAARDHPGADKAGVQCLTYDEIMDGQETDTSHFSGSNIQGTLLDALVAGTVTSCSTLMFIILHLVANPQIQQQIRDDITKHVTDKPTWSMREGGLKLLFAVVQEVLRIYRNIPLPHCAVQDTSLDGFRIPKGTVVLVNMWALHNDDKVWDDPHRFNPYRFLDPNNSAKIKENWMPFSAGSRGCVGYQMAQMELFLLTAMLVKKFKFEAAEGCEPDVDPDPTSRVMRVKNSKACVAVSLAD